ncbi:hypothetical protein AXG93_632s1180 [Marchantia polymorpha subsp. ruderalis]|uniref:Mannosyltransferase n=1 Tax=Marchantia polymorpha subsp. ruderalis TaxID=1480154 RepID=A0A176WHD6_MARPO|nr:hypothetical protein AXG93_632s1180 [Marchantia polymorpha subsp. ruderalis]
MRASAPTAGQLVDRWDVLMAAIAGLHIVLTPYTKVEESFNIQAMHDILFHQENLHQYDHLEFPGVVPRTFLGAIFVSMVAYPFVFAMKLLGIPKLYALFTGLETVWSANLQIFCNIDYCSVSSLVLLLSPPAEYFRIGFGTFLEDSDFEMNLRRIWCPCAVSESGIYQLVERIPGINFEVVAAAVFRCDMILLLAPVGATLLLARSISFWNAVKCCAITAILSIGLSVAVDSIFWQRRVWPEFEVLWFNSVLNRSSEWGRFRSMASPFELNVKTSLAYQKTSPFHWYFTSALPRAMMAGLPLALLGVLLERRTAKFVLPVLIFITLYSKLPHKELRFILVGVPVLNIAGATAMARIYNNRWKPGFIWRTFYSLALVMLMASFGVSMVIAAASHANYPGGHALRVLHSKEAVASEVSEGFVHIDVLTAMTGVSRFCEVPHWRYSKEEGLFLEDYSLRNFTHLLNEKDSIPGFLCLQAIPGFSRLRLQKTFPQLLVVTEPKVFVHRAEYLDDADTGEWPGCDAWSGTGWFG